MQDRHTEAYRRRIGEVRALPGARALLARLTELGCPFAIATSGRMATAGPALELLACRTASRSSPVISCLTPNPTPICSSKPCASSALTSSTLWWSATACGTCLPRGARARIGLLSGGYGTDELERAGAYRVYDDPADLLDHLDEIGVRPERMVPG